MKKFTYILSAAVFVGVSLNNVVVAQVNGPAANFDTKRVVEHWTKSRRDQAIPRDFVIDNRGLGYLRRADGSLQPYGHGNAPQLRATKPKPAGKPQNPGGGSGDSTPPVISNMDPHEGDVIGASRTFSATVTDDASGVKSVAFVITYPDGITTQSFSPAYTGNDVWSITLQGFSNGNWSWHVVAKDGGDKGGNSATSNTVHFSVDTGGGSTGGGGGAGGYVVTNAQWTAGGAVQTAAGRIYFEMPNNSKRKGPWTGYVCSGTVANDGTTGRSVIITAAHCVYDDSNKAFARNVLFIPDQANTTGSGTDLNCNNDPLGCWVPSFGVVDTNWTTRVFPDNIAWDYAYYVVSDSGAHAGTAVTSIVLDTAAGSLSVSFSDPIHDDGTPSASSGDFTHALGYSYNQDPNFMYCAEDMTTEGAVNWWLPNCGLSGGSSGGPWLQPVNSGNGPIISVNSWGYTNSPGMAGPKLAGTSASCVFNSAIGTAFGVVAGSDGDAGVKASCP